MTIQTPEPTPEPSQPSGPSQPSKRPWLVPVLVTVVVFLAVGMLGTAAYVLLTTDNSVVEQVDPQPNLSPSTPPESLIPSTPEPTPTEPDYADTAEYAAVQGLLKVALRDSGVDPQVMCITYAQNPQKWEYKFTNTAMRTIADDRQIAEAAVHDFFVDRCGT